MKYDKVPMTPSQRKYLKALEIRGIEIVSIAKIHDGRGCLSVYFQNPHLLAMSHVVLGKRGGTRSLTYC